MTNLVRVSPSRLVALAVAVATCGLVLSACGAALGGAGDGTEESSDPASLKVETQDWTGWSREQPQPSTRTVEVRVGESIDIEALGDTRSFEVTDIEVKHVSLSSDEAWSPRSESGGIDLTSTQTQFEVTASEPLEVSTPTMDGGTTVTISLA